MSKSSVSLNKGISKFLTSKMIFRLDELLCDVSLKSKLAKCGILRGATLSVKKKYFDGSLLLNIISEIGKNSDAIIGAKVADLIMVSKISDENS